MKIPFSPPLINDEIIAEVVETLRSGWITTGPKSKELECEIGNLTEIKNVLTVNSATSGLMLALNWFGVKEGDEVIIPAYTYVATALSVINLGAKPVFVECGRDMTISPAAIANKLSDKTKAVIPVDIAGLPCRYNSIRKVISNKRFVEKFAANNSKQKKLGRILILSDAAHSLGATYYGKPACLQADISVTSFHAAKNITTAEGGALMINLPSPFDCDEEYKILKLSSLNGQSKNALEKSKEGEWKYDILLKGYKFNLPDVLAAMALPIIKKYKEIYLPKRKKLFEKYVDMFSDWDEAQIPIGKSLNRESAYHFFPLLIKNISEEIRDRIIENMSRQGIHLIAHYTPITTFSYFKREGFKSDKLKATLNLSSREISLPIYHTLTEEQVIIIAQKIKTLYASLKKNKF